MCVLIPRVRFSSGNEAVVPGGARGVPSRAGVVGAKVRLASRGARATATKARGGAGAEAPGPAVGPAVATATRARA